MKLYVQNPSTFFVQRAYELYNSVRNADLPQKAGVKYGIDDSTWTKLIETTKAKLLDMAKGDKNLVPRDENGLCIYASVVAAKFFVLRNHILDTHVVRVDGKSDHYYAVAAFGGPPIICDLTCRQFGGPKYFVGTLAELKPSAKQVQAMGSNLYEIYKLGTQTRQFVV